MKRTFFMLCCCLIAVISTAQNYFYVEKTDGTKIPFAYNEVTRISFNHEQNGDSDSLTTEIPSNVIIPDGAITVAEAREICSGLSSGETTSEKYYVKGWVKKLHNNHNEATIEQYGNGQFYMVDDMSDSDDFMAYQVYGLNGEKLTSVDQVEVGDYVVVYGQLTNYSGTYETVGKGAAYIYSSSNEKLQGDIVIPDDDVETINIARAIEIINGLALSGETTEEYMIKATLTQVYTTGENVAKYGNLNINVTDETGSLDCYYTNNVGNVKFTSESEVPAIGTVLLLRGKLKNYAKNDVGTPEMINGYIVEIIGEGTGDNTGGDSFPTEIPSNVTIPDEAITVAEAREICSGLASGAETSEKYYVKGWVNKLHSSYEADVTGFGNVRFYMVDNMGDSDDFLAYQVYGLNGEKITSTNQVAAGDYVVVYGPLTNYNGTYETTGKGTAHIYSSSNPNIAGGGDVNQGDNTGGNDTPETPVEGDVDITFNNSLGDWTYSGVGEFYGNGGLKVNQEGKTLTSPQFEAANTVDVTLTIGVLNQNAKTGTNGVDGDNFKVEGLDADGAVVSTEYIKTPEVKSYTVTLEGTGISKVAITMVSFPYNGSAYCNVNLAGVSIKRK